MDETPDRPLEFPGAVAYRSFPYVGHSMHGERPELYVETLLDWVESIAE